jgi:hypothetical protein
MSNIAVAAEKNMLEWNLVVGTPTRPAGCFLGLSPGSPSSISASEVGAGSGYTRQSASFGAAATPAGSPATATNQVALTFGTFSSSAVMSGWQLWDMVTAGSGVMQWFGTLSVPRTVQPGDSLIIPAGSLAISLS